MKRTLAFIGLAMACLAIVFGDSTTTNLGLTIPDVGSTNWGNKLNNNFSIIDSSVGVLSGTSTFTAPNTFYGPVSLGRGNNIRFYSSDNTHYSFMDNPTVNSTSLEIDSNQGVGINSIPLGPESLPVVSPAIGLSIFPSLNGTLGTFAVVGSSANAAQAYSGFTATSPISASTLWSLPKTDGSANQALITDGSAHLSFGTPTLGTAGAITATSVNISGGLWVGTTTLGGAFNSRAEIFSSDLEKYTLYVSTIGAPQSSYQFYISTAGSAAFRGQVAIASNTVLSGATFYSNAPARLGTTIISSATISSLYLDANPITGPGSISFTPTGGITNEWYFDSSGLNGFTPSFNSVTISALDIGLLASGASTVRYDFLVSSKVATNTNFHVAVSTSGHLLTSGSLPTVGTCGSSPSVVGDDNEGIITMGSGGTNACTLTFAKAWGATPSCVFNSSATYAGASAKSQTAVTIALGVALGSATIDYQCGCSGTGCR